MTTVKYNLALIHLKTDSLKNPWAKDQVGCIPETLTVSPNKFILGSPNTGVRKNAALEIIWCPHGGERENIIFTLDSKSNQSLACEQK